MDALGEVHRDLLATFLAGIYPDGHTSTHDAYLFAARLARRQVVDGLRFIVLVTDGLRAS